MGGAENDSGLPDGCVIDGIWDGDCGAFLRWKAGALWLTTRQPGGRTAFVLNVIEARHLGNLLLAAAQAPTVPMDGAS